MSPDSKRVEGDFPVHFRYTAGIAGEKFLREIKDNAKLIAARCPRCQLNYVPPRIYCERCLTRLEEYIPVESMGTVESFTICTRDSEGRPLPEPTNIALVRFASAHGGLVHRTNEKVSVGDKVRPVFREKTKRVGSILDIEYFEKVP
jgi:uncharacterized OB-fold protein